MGSMFDRSEGITATERERYEREARELQDKNFRLQCLHLAAGSFENEVPGEMVVKTAQQFYDFLEGKGSARVH